MLEGIFDDACRNQAFEHDSEHGRELALRLLALFNAGMVEEADLRNVIEFFSPQ